MIVVRRLRVLVVGGVLAWLLGLAAVSPAPLLFAVTQPLHRTAGALVVLGPVALVVWGAAATRRGLLALGGPLPVPADEPLVAAVAHAARDVGAPVPTCWVATTPLPRPVVLRGLRATHLLAPPEAYDDPAALARTVRADAGSGAARLLPLFLALPPALAGWSGALGVTTAAVRPGRTSVLDRLVLLVLVPLAVPAALGWVVAWVAVQAARLVVPRWFVTVALAADGGPRRPARRGARPAVRLGPGVHLGTMLATGDVELPEPRASDGWAGVPSRLARAAGDGPVVSAVRVAVAVVVLWSGTFAGLGRLPAERVVWPFEGTPTTAAVTQVVADPRGADSVLGRLGLDVASTWQPVVRTDDGATVVLEEGTVPVAEGDRLRVVPTPGAGGGETLRAHVRSAAGDLVVSSSVLLLLALGLHRAAGGLLPLAEERRVRQVDWDQRGATGRRRRARRPRDLGRLDPSR